MGRMKVGAASPMAPPSTGYRNHGSPLIQARPRLRGSPAGMGSGGRRIGIGSRASRGTAVRVEPFGVAEINWTDLEKLKANRPALILELMMAGDGSGFRRAIEQGFDVDAGSDIVGPLHTPLRRR